MFKAVQQAWNGLPGIVQGGVGLSVAVGGGIIVSKEIKKAKIRKQKKLFDSSNKPITVTDAKGNAVTITINTAATAAKIYDAIHNNDFFGWTEDETAIVNALKPVPKAYIPEVALNYFKLYGKNLQQEVISALDDDEWKQVDYLFN